MVKRRTLPSNSLDDNRDSTYGMVHDITSHAMGGTDGDDMLLQVA